MINLCEQKRQQEGCSTKVKMFTPTPYTEWHEDKLKPRQGRVWQVWQVWQVLGERSPPLPSIFPLFPPSSPSPLSSHTPHTQKASYIRALRLTSVPFHPTP